MEITCIYKQRYYNHESQENQSFECKIESLENKKFCLFHDETYLKDSNHHENKDNVINKLNEKIDNSISKNTHLLRIGYYLPDIKINKNFVRCLIMQEIYCKFQNATFSGATLAEANFSRVTFSAKDILDFSRAAFSGRTYFSEL